MFFTFLNKEDYNCLDLSVLQKHTPESVLFYYYNSIIKISLKTYLAIQDEQNSITGEWIKLFTEELKLGDDIKILSENEYIDILGPYYYPKTNTRFYFIKNNAPELITAEDLDTLISLRHTPAIAKNVLSYYKSRKNSKNTYKNKEELLKDLEMCITSLRETEKVHIHMNYLNKFLEQRYAIVEESDIFPPEPDTLPEKPQKAEETTRAKDNLIPFNVRRKPKKTGEKDPDQYHLERKIYIMRYREYEKACDRYKLVLQNWTEYQQRLLDICLKEIEKAESQLKSSYKSLDIYNNILEKSFVHTDYQDIKTLDTFKYYLETGRANDLQDCMNLFEEEKHWHEIKASQDRIENTIYFLQSENTMTRIADEHIGELLQNVNDKITALDKS